MIPARLHRRRDLWLALLFGACGTLALAQRPATPVHIVTPAEITWTSVPGYPPGYARMMLEVQPDDAGAHTYRVRLPAGYKAEPHTHPSDEHVTILSGTWYLGVGETFDRAALKALPAGSFILVPAGTPHFISIEEETIVQVHGVGRMGLSYVKATRGQ